MTIEEITKQFDLALADLRHAYFQLSSYGVYDQKEFAIGLIGPAITRIENIIDPLKDIIKEHNDKNC